MNTRLIAAALSLGLVATPAMADQPSEKTEAKAAAFSIDTPIEKLVADPRAKAVLDKYTPGIDQHPAYSQFQSLSLKELQPFSQGAITPETLEKIKVDLATIK